METGRAATFMSLAIDLTKNQAEIELAEREASALLRRARNVIPPAIYAELQLKLCTIACEGTRLKTNLGALRMPGDLEQRPPEVRAESLEFSDFIPRCMVFPDVDTARRTAEERIAPMFPGRDVKVPRGMAEAFRAAGDHTFEEPIFDRHVSVEEQEEGTQRG